MAIFTTADDRIFSDEGIEQPAVPSLTIEELSGPRRRLELREWCLPLKEGAAWRARQRFAREWYPGNPVATLQVLGTEELPSTLRFRFDRRRMAAQGGGTGSRAYARVTAAGSLRSGAGLDEALSVPLDLAQLLDDIRQAGQEIEVTWGVLTRRGLLAQVEIQPESDVLVEVSTLFEWTSRGPLLTASISPDFDFATVSNQIADAIAGLAAGLARPARFAADLLDQANGYVLEIEAATEELASVMDEYPELFDSGRNVIQNVASIGGTLVEEAVALSAVFDVDAANAASSSRVDDVLGAEAAIIGAQDEARKIKALGDLVRREALALFGGDDVLAVEVSPAGATLQQYAAAYYDDPTKWTVIARHNDLRGAALEEGTIVAIPALDAVAAE